MCILLAGPDNSGLFLSVLEREVHFSRAMFRVMFSAPFAEWKLVLWSFVRADYYKTGVIIYFACFN